MRALLCLLLLSIPAAAMEHALGYCEQGNYSTVTGGVSSTTKVQRSFPSCTVTVYDAGTANVSTIYSDNSSTPLANPFAATSTGLWGFYAANGRYDIQLSGANIPTPFKLFDVLLNDSSAGSFSAITNGTNTTATMTVGSGASLTYSGTGIVNATRILGTTLTGLTGPIKMTAGVPSVAASADIIALWSGSCSASTVLFGDGSCAASGSYYQTMQSNTTPQTQRTALNFSTQFSLSDSASPSRTTVDLAATITANTSGNAATATALAANPTDCAANQFANAIAANGNLTCAQPAAADLSNGTTGTGAVVQATSPTIVTPTIASFANATHTHQNSAGGGTLAQAAIQPILPIFAQTNSVTVGNTVTETTLAGTGQGSLTLPAAFFVAGKTLRVRMSGYFSATAGPTIRLKLYFGATAILDTGAVTSSNLTDKFWTFDGTITCRTTGGTGTVMAQGVFIEDATAPFGAVNTTTVTIDTTATQAVDLKVTWGTAAAGNTITSTNFTLGNDI